MTMMALPVSLSYISKILVLQKNDSTTPRSQSLRTALRVKAAPLHLMGYKTCSALTEQYGARLLVFCVCVESSVHQHTHVFLWRCPWTIPMLLYPYLPLTDKKQPSKTNSRFTTEMLLLHIKWGCSRSETVTDLSFFFPPGGKGHWRIRLMSSALPRKLQRRDHEWTSWAAPSLTM